MKQKTNAETIRVLTPIFLAFVGVIIAICAFVSTEDNTRFTSAMGLASTAIAGAAGLAQEPTSNSSEELRDRENIRHQPVNH